MEEDKCDGCKHRYCYYNENCGYCNDCNNGSNYAYECSNDDNETEE